jgi:DNA-binding transcriptional regulator YiaG
MQLTEEQIQEIRSFVRENVSKIREGCKHPGQVLRRFRTEVLKMTQKELAELLGTTARSVSDWEANKRVPRLKYVRQIWLQFGLDLAGFEKKRGSIVL